MKVIMPMAGKGTRLLPLTKRVPKPLVNVAGRPVMDYVMDALRRAGQLDELIIITGHLKEKVEDYVRKHYDIPARFIEQKVLDGTAGAVNLARPYVDGPVIVIFVDTLFDADLSIVKTTKADGIIWTKEVEDYQRFGVVVTDKQGQMTQSVEKPSTPMSRRANIGLQHGKNRLVSAVGGSYDCGKVDTLAETNQHLLAHGRGQRPTKVPAGVQINDP